MDHFTVQLNIPKKRIAELLTCAMEGGIGYWGQITGFIEPMDFEYRDDPIRLYKHIDFPMNTGGGVNIFVGEGGVKGREDYTLMLQDLQKGLEVMAKKYPGDFGRFIADNEDAETGDVFVQCALFGEVIFG